MLELGLWVEMLDEGRGREDPDGAPLAQPAEAFAESALSRLHRKVEKLGGRALAGTPGARHELRVAIKRLRYAGEFFASLYDAKPTRRYLKRLARLQDQLGLLNDADTAGHLLRELSARGEPDGAIDLARAAGFVEGFSLRDDDAAAARLERRWERLRKAHPFWQPSASD
jgi:CHAD domain-containing protein